MPSTDSKLSKKDKREPLPDWVDVQADLSLCWLQRSTCRFCRALAHLSWLPFSLEAVSLYIRDSYDIKRVQEVNNLMKRWFDNWKFMKTYLQSNLNCSNTDGSFAIANSNSFLSPNNFSDSSRKQIFQKIFLFYHEIVCCVYSLESPHWGDSNEHPQHTIIVCKIDKKKLP